MGLMDKLRQLISPHAPHKQEQTRVASRQTPQFGTSSLRGVLPQDASLNDPLLIASSDEDQDHQLGPVLDHEWELYSPNQLDVIPMEEPLELDDSLWDHSVEEDKSADHQQEFIKDDFDLSNDPLKSTLLPSLYKPSKPISVLSALPATDFLHEVPPPLVDDDGSLDQANNMLWSEQDHLEEDSVFIPSNQRRDSPLRSHLSLALLPVAIPSPLSYALVYRDQITEQLSYTENREVNERNTEKLIEVFERYTTLVPNDLHMWRDYSDLLIETKGLEYAYDQVKTALGKTRDDTGYLLMLADMSRRMCDTHTAWHYITLLNELHPNNIDVLLQLRDIQHDCTFYELAENTDAHIERLLKGQQRSVDPLS